MSRVEFRNWVIKHMLLVFDIGNTNTVLGVFSGDQLRTCFRLKSDTGRTADEYSVYIRALLKDFVAGEKISAAVISSVVPPLTSRFVTLVKENFSVTPLVVGPGIKTGLSIKTAEPGRVGADRIVNSVAARARYGAPALIVDFGTATSFDVIDADNNYLGGAIAPGVEISINALVERTAKLPRIDFSWPDKVVGNDTVKAMQSGSIVGYACMCDGLIRKIKQEVSGIKQVIATGGLGRLFHSHCELIDTYDEQLTLYGMYELARINGFYSRGQQSNER